MLVDRFRECQLLPWNLCKEPSISRNEESLSVKWKSSSFQKLFGPWPAPAAWWTQTSCPVKELPVRGAAVTLQRKPRSDILHRLSWKPNTPTSSRAAGGRREKVFPRPQETREDEWGTGRKKENVHDRGDNEVTWVSVTFDFIHLCSIRRRRNFSQWKRIRMKLKNQLSLQKKHLWMTTRRIQEFLPEQIFS